LKYFLTQTFDLRVIFVASQTDEEGSWKPK